MAIVTALLPVYTETGNIAAEIAWDDAMKVVARILRDKDAGERIAVIAHLGNIAASLAVRCNIEDPYEVVRELGQAHF